MPPVHYTSTPTRATLAGSPTPSAAGASAGTPVSATAGTPMSAAAGHAAGFAANAARAAMPGGIASPQPMPSPLLVAAGSPGTAAAARAGGSSSPALLNTARWPGTRDRAAAMPGSSIPSPNAAPDAPAAAGGCRPPPPPPEWAARLRQRHGAVVSPPSPGSGASRSAREASSVNVVAAAPHPLLTNGVVYHAVMFISRYVPAVGLYWVTLRGHLHHLPVPWQRALNAVNHKSPFILLAFLFSPRLFLLTGLVGLAFVGGYLWSLGIPALRHPASTLDSQTAYHQQLARWAQRFDPDWPLDGTDSAALQTLDHPDLSALEPETAAALQHFVGLIVRDYVHSWFARINYSGVPEFPLACEGALQDMLLRLGQALGRVETASTLLPVVQILIVHIREYRAFEASAQTLQDYLATHAMSSFALHMDDQAIYSHLRHLAYLLARRTLPENEVKSTVILSFIKEVLGTSLLSTLVNTIADPDWINRLIIKLVKAHAAKSATTAQQAAALAAAAGGVGVGAAGVSSQALTLEERRRRKGYSTAASQIYIKVLEARRLPITQSSGLYCNLFCGKDQDRTAKVNGESNPFWMEEFEFDWLQSPDGRPTDGGSGGGGGDGTPLADNDRVDGIVIDVMDSKTFRDEIIGSAYVSTRELVANKFTKGWYRLDTSESRYAEAATTAEIHLEMILISTAVPDDTLLAADAMVDSRITALQAAPSTASPSTPAPAAAALTHGTVSRPEATASAAASTTTSASTIANRRPAVPPRAPETPAQPPLTIQNVFSQPDALHQLIAYLKPMNEHALIHMYITLDNFRQTASAPTTSHESLMTTAASILDTFFGAAPTNDVAATPTSPPPPPPPPPAGPLGQPLAGANVIRSNTAIVTLAGLVRSQLKEGHVHRDTFRKIQGKIYGLLQQRWDGFAASPFFPKPPTVAQPALPARAPAAAAHAAAPPPPPARPPPAHGADAAATPPPSKPSLQPLSLADRATALGSQARDHADTRSAADASEPDVLGSLETASALARAQETGDRQFMFTAVATLREQLMVVDSAMEEAQSSKQIKALAATKISLHTQIEQLLDLIAEAEEAELAAQQRQQAGGRVPPALHLHHVHVKVHDAGGSGFFEVPLPKDAANTSVFSRQTKVFPKADYIVQVEKADGSAQGWVITKTYQDFYQLNEQMRAVFPKVDKMAFPVPAARIPRQPHAVMAVDVAEALANELGKWINVLVTDGLLAQSPMLVDFMRPENFSQEEETDALRAIDSAAAPVSQNKMLGAFRNAGSVLRKVAVAPQKAAFMVVSGVETAAGGIAAGMQAGFTAAVGSGTPTPTLTGGTTAHPNDPYTAAALRKASTASAMADMSPSGLPSASSLGGLAATALASPAPSYAVMDATDRGSAPLGAAPMVLPYAEHGPATGGTLASPAVGSPAVGSPAASRPPDHPRGSGAGGSQGMETPRAMLASAQTSALVLAAPAGGAGGVHDAEMEAAFGPRATSATTSGLPAAANDPGRTAPAGDAPKRVLSDQETEIILECLFGAIEEVFHLSDPNQWIRQKGLHILKGLLRRNYGSAIAGALQRAVEDARSEAKARDYLTQLMTMFWPGDTWYHEVAREAAREALGASATPEQVEAMARPVRTETQMADTKLEAKQLWVYGNIPGVETVQRVVGKTNTTVGMTRLFNMLQQRDLNRHLLCCVLESLVKNIVHADDPA
ncbi:hypothetical protein CXG81DRAFT_17169 [Caulochytrium protostelioides]|uniref:PXA domain-containing protein n=1 Tax=Caulochytrium protostelioides TaxID=1555241 RepID=A0A4P9XDS8_9FUNG|nr:hypothetical protein CXG81DRAFT_17169 [Caulochytrium protostelioides]|eukprot:RKP03320.1 hypothetical protein CXG81DRAFT_17169 [Caulochytrium protostelioides]